jgi:HlyD family secretion protein
VPSAADLAADQAAVDAAQAQVAVDRQDLARTSLVTPISGTVAAVDLVAGQTVSADSTSDDILVTGPSGYDVTVSVPVTDIASLKVGDPASVVPDGVSTTLPATVTSIGLAPTSDTSDYPVTLALSGASPALHDGSSSSVSIVLASASSVLSVPTSAIHVSGTSHTVTVLRNGKTSSVKVGVGVVGSVLTQITSGLTAGEQVVLANLSEGVPTSNAPTFTSRELTGGLSGGLAGLTGGGGFRGGGGGFARGGGGFGGAR